MTVDINTQEALAHYTRGAVTLFYVFWSIILRKYNKRSQMMELLYLTSVLISICYVKDVLFTIDSFTYSDYLNSISGITDIVYVPAIAAFFLEVVRPGTVTKWQMFTAIALQACFIPIYILWPSEKVVLMASLVAYSISATTVVFMTLFVTRYRKMMFDTYSYTDNIDVQWVLFSCYAYFGTLVLYSLSFKNTTWFSEIVFNITGIIIWSVVFRLAQRHRVLKMFRVGKENKAEESICGMPVEKENDNVDDNEDYVADSNEEDIMEHETEEPHEDTKRDRDRIIALRLQLMMEQQKIYLLPKLTIGELAQKIGTNKTYLSICLNNSLHISFHDYVNKFRINEACAIMDSLTIDSKHNMAEISVACGFNSISSFNRHFLKFKGVSPRDYLVEKCKQAL